MEQCYNIIHWIGGLKSAKKCHVLFEFWIKEAEIDVLGMSATWKKFNSNRKITNKLIHIFEGEKMRYLIHLWALFNLK